MDPATAPPARGIARDLQLPTRWTSGSRSPPGSSTSPPTRCSRGRAAGRPSRRSPTGWRWSRPASTCSTSARWRRKAGRRWRQRSRRRRWCRRSRGWRVPGVPISADTFSVEVARRALDAGAVAVNDISGGSDEMFELVAESGCGYVLMHIEGPPRVDRPAPRLRRRRRPPGRVVRGASRARP